jgi:CxxC-x17-CxxC domain-containing protein
MSYADKTIACRDCATQFSFTSGEQEFYAQKGFTNEPTRCPSCRQQRKAGGGGRSGGYDSRDSYSSGGYDDRSSYGSSSYSSGGYSRGEREMHSATCASCGKEARVPFVPRGDKPVYCSDCFQQQRQSTGSSNSRW